MWFYLALTGAGSCPVYTRPQASRDCRLVHLVRLLPVGRRLFLNTGQGAPAASPAADAWEWCALNESPIERLFREAAARLWPGAHPLVQELHVGTAYGQRRIDFAVPSLRLAIELESWEWHGKQGPVKITEDRARERALESQGWRVVTFTGQEVTASAERCVQEALQIARLSPLRVGARAHECDGPYTCRQCEDNERKNAEYAHYEVLLNEHEKLWQCRKLCLRALTRGRPLEFAAWPRDVPLLLLDASGLWDAYERRYDYTACVYERLPANADCEHLNTRSCIEPVLAVPGWACEDCGTWFPPVGSESLVLQKQAA